MAKPTYFATSPTTGRVFTRTSDRIYTHAVIFRWAFFDAAQSIAFAEECLRTGLRYGHKMSKGTVAKTELTLKEARQGFMERVTFCGSRALAVSQMHTLRDKSPVLVELFATATAGKPSRTGEG